MWPNRQEASPPWGSSSVSMQSSWINENVQLRMFLKAQSKYISKDTCVSINSYIGAHSLKPYSSYINYINYIEERPFRIM